MILLRVLLRVLDNICQVDWHSSILALNCKYKEGKLRLQIFWDQNMGLTLTLHYHLCRSQQLLRSLERANKRAEREAKAGDDPGISDDDDEKTEDDMPPKELSPKPAEQLEPRDSKVLKTRHSLNARQNIKQQDSEPSTQPRTASRKQKKTSEVESREKGRSSQTPQPAKRPRLATKTVSASKPSAIWLTVSLYTSFMGSMIPSTALPLQTSRSERACSLAACCQSWRTWCEKQCVCTCSSQNRCLHWGDIWQASRIGPLKFYEQSLMSIPRLRF